MGKSNKIFDNVIHHGQLLENSLPFLSGFLAGLAVDKPFIWKSSVLCPYRGKNIVIRGTTKNIKFDSIEIFVSGLSKNGKIIINYLCFEKDIEEIMFKLFEIKRIIDRIIDGEKFETAEY